MNHNDHIRMSKPLSKEFLLKRGSCCDNDCTNCPYKEKKNMKKEDDKQDKIMFATWWFCAGMLITQLLMLLTRTQ